MFEQEPGINQNRQMHICPNCRSDLVEPVWWKCNTPKPKMNQEGTWTVKLMCPDCEYCDIDEFTEAELADYDEVLESAKESIINQADTLGHEQMEEYVGRFAMSLRNDLILPEDF